MTNKSKYEKWIISLLEEIRDWVDKLIEDKTDEITSRYGTDSPTEEMILSRLYPDQDKEGVNIVDAALGIRILLVDISLRKKMPLPLAMYNIGVLRSFVSISNSETKLPFEALKLIKSEMGRQDVNKRHKPMKQAKEEAKEIGKQKWLYAIDNAKTPKTHEKLADQILRENPSYKEKGLSEATLRKELIEVAKDIDPEGLHYLIRGNKKLK